MSNEPERIRNSNNHADYCATHSSGICASIDVSKQLHHLCAIHSDIHRWLLGMAGSNCGTIHSFPRSRWRKVGLCPRRNQERIVRRVPPCFSNEGQLPNSWVFIDKTPDAIGDHEGVSWHNNDAEWAIHQVAPHHKISGDRRTWTGAEVFWDDFKYLRDRKEAWR